MDNFRYKIKDFFNEKWLGSKKNREQLSLSVNIDHLQFHYERVYGVKMSTSQICEMLICDELTRVERNIDYNGIFARSNLMKLRCEYELVKTSFSSVEVDENLNPFEEIEESDDDFDFGAAFDKGFNGD